MRSMLALATVAVVLAGPPLAADPPPSLADTEARRTIIDFVTRVTYPGSPDYVTPADRIATFDNDGTLWSEQPVHFQGLFAIDRLREMAAQDGRILTSDALRAAVQADMATVAAAGEAGLPEVLATTHAALTVDAFVTELRDWMATARHPVTAMAYDAMAYQPMPELLRYLRDEGFSDLDRLGRRPALHPRLRRGSLQHPAPAGRRHDRHGKLRRDAWRAGHPRGRRPPLHRRQAGKPLAIEARIVRRLIRAVGNPDGDFEMLEWTTSGPGPRLGILIHHTDGAREFAYDRGSHVGRLSRGLAEGPGRGWLIVDMAEDWRRVWAGG